MAKAEAPRVNRQCVRTVHAQQGGMREARANSLPGAAGPEIPLSIPIPAPSMYPNRIGKTGPCRRPAGHAP